MVAGNAGASEYIDNNGKLGLSSIEYDSETSRLYLLTSFEEDNKEKTPSVNLGSYLWAIPFDKLGEKSITLDVSNCYLNSGGSKPKSASEKVQPEEQQVGKKQNEIVCLQEFNQHKAEGLAILDKTHVLLVFDDDRVKTQLTSGDNHQERNPDNEAGYQILEIQ